MEQNLKEGKRLYRKGKIGAASAALQSVLREYAWCPTPLSNEEIAMYVQPAEQLLRRCFDESGVGDEAMALRGKEDDLIERMQEGISQLYDQELALEEVRSELERLKKSQPEAMYAYARGEIERRTDDARQSLQRGEKPEATDAYRDVVTLLDWFPELDPAGEIRRDVAKQLASLEAAAGREVEGPEQPKSGASELPNRSA